MPKRALWKRWANVLLPAMVLIISVFNFFHRRRYEKPAIFVIITSGLLTLFGIARFFAERDLEN